MARSIRNPVVFRVIFAALLLSGSALAQYSENLSDINARYLGMHVGPGTHAPTPIGDLGKIEYVVDIRGFVPMSFRSKQKDAITLSNMTKLQTALQWYKVPTKKALLMLYYGNLTSDNLASDTTRLENDTFANTRFLDESNAKGETVKWCDVAYNLAEKDSKRIFDQLIGGETFTAAEPTTIFFTRDSVFVIMNYRYSQWNYGDRGQALVAMEFSRRLKRVLTYLTHRLRRGIFALAVTGFALLSQKLPPWKVFVLAVIVMIAALRLPPGGCTSEGNLSAKLVSKTIFVGNKSKNENGKRPVPNLIFLGVVHHPIGRTLSTRVGDRINILRNPLGIDSVPSISRWHFIRVALLVLRPLAIFYVDGFPNIPSFRLPLVLNPDLYHEGLSRIQGYDGFMVNSGAVYQDRGIYGDVWSFVQNKLTPKISPLEVCDYGVKNREEIGNYLDSVFPPFKRVVLLFIGFGLMFWGWPNLKRERHLPASGICVVVGMLLTLAGWIVFLSSGYF